jgi:hypothetical protein
VVAASAAAPLAAEPGTQEHPAVEHKHICPIVLGVTVFSDFAKLLLSPGGFNLLEPSKF